MLFLVLYTVVGGAVLGSFRFFLLYFFTLPQVARTNKIETDQTEGDFTDDTFDRVILPTKIAIDRFFNYIIFYIFFGILTFFFGRRICGVFFNQLREKIKPQ